MADQGGPSARSAQQALTKFQELESQVRFRGAATAPEARRLARAPFSAKWLAHLEHLSFPSDSLGVVSLAADIPFHCSNTAAELPLRPRSRLAYLLCPLAATALQQQRVAAGGAGYRRPS